MVSEGNSNESPVNTIFKKVFLVFSTLKNLRHFFVDVIVHIIFIMKRCNLHWACIPDILKNILLIFL